MKWKFEEIGSQKGRIAVVTGANVGLGYETALALAGREMDVVLACRNMEKAGQARENILKQIPNASVTTMNLDLSRLNSVRVFAELFSSQYQRLDLLINNAGIMIPPYSLTEEGFESQFGTNYLGHFALTGRLFPVIEKTALSRVVSLSSLAHIWGTIDFGDLQFKKGYHGRKAYGQSKLACLMFAYELQRRLKKTGGQTISIAVHPGMSHTNLAQHLPKALQGLSPILTQSAKAGAQPTLAAALSPLMKGGEYVGPGKLKQTRGKPAFVGSTSSSRNEAIASRLWEVSETLTGVKFLS